MVKALFLGLLAAMMCGFACAAPAPQPELPSRREETTPPPQPPLEDPAARSERSTNLSHVTGTARKIQMFIKNRHLQLLPDGTVNGTTDDTSAYTILQRTTVGIGQMKIQGVATCQYLCMDSCGLLYGSREFGDECIFNETIEQHHYNTYSSTKYSNERRTLYLALNRRGQPRKVQLRARQQLGRLSSYTRVLTRTVAPERAEDLHPLRHHTHMCSSTPTTIESNGRLPTPTADRPIDPPRCRKRRKRKKKKRKCPPDGESETELCHKRHNTSNHRKLQPNRLVKKCENEDSDECQRDVTVNKKKQKNSDRFLSNGPKKKKNAKKGAKKRHPVPVITSTEVATTATDDVTHDEDYGLDSTTHWDWDDSTAVPDVSMSISMSMPGTQTSAQPD
ncbi:hypothetical protein Zmor_003549 [Zophobas morio]|uniref:Fibroblast growth factor n=1 Tax=Zophobas morio TaxID=2755281 RepID=A0AA38M261_9CUCU|nr:hypothetical protein Zmor_003549 [Zophobas morio]